MNQVRPGLSRGRIGILVLGLSLWTSVVAAAYGGESARALVEAEETRFPGDSLASLVDAMAVGGPGAHLDVRADAVIVDLQWKLYAGDYPAITAAVVTERGSAQWKLSDVSFSVSSLDDGDVLRGVIEIASEHTSSSGRGIRVAADGLRRSQDYAQSRDEPGGVRYQDDVAGYLRLHSSTNLSFEQGEILAKEVELTGDIIGRFGTSYEIIGPVARWNSSSIRLTIANGTATFREPELVELTALSGTFETFDRVAVADAKGTASIESRLVRVRGDLEIVGHTMMQAQSTPYPGACPSCPISSEAARTPQKFGFESEQASISVNGALVNVPPAKARETSFGAFVAAAIYALYHRIRASHALQHPQRALVHGLIAANPGISIAGVGELTQIPPGTLGNHLAVLERCQLIVKHRRDRSVLLTLPGAAAPPLIVLRGRAQQVLNSLRRGGAKAPAEVAEELGIDRQLAHHHLRRLAEAGLVRAARNSTRGTYEVESAMEARDP